LVLMVECFHQDEYLSQFLGLFLYGLVNFLMNKFLTFPDRP
jgi:putative flippase GtrA